MKTALITGGSKGIGLEFARQYLAKGYRIFAASREAEKSEELSYLQTQYPERLSIHRLDVGSEQSRTDLFRVISMLADKLDLLINNAGILSGDEERYHPFGELDQADLSRTFLINSIAPLMMVERFYSLLKAGTQPLVVNLTSDNGSIARRNQPGKYGYCASKAALNMITRILSFELRDSGIIAVALHPGWVQTWMTRHEDAPLTPAESIGGMVRVIDALTQEDSGKFLDWQGNEIPW